jgi:hypothetical protein
METSAHQFLYIVLKMYVIFIQQYVMIQYNLNLIDNKICIYFSKSQIQ